MVALVKSSFQLVSKIIIFVKTTNFSFEVVKQQVEEELSKYSNFSEVVVIEESTGQMRSFNYQ